MSLGDEMIEGLKKALQDLKDGKPLKTTTVAKFSLTKFLVENNLTVSISNGKRLVTQGAVKLNGVIQTDWNADIFVRNGDILEVGRKKIEIKIHETL